MTTSILYLDKRWIFSLQKQPQNLDPSYEIIDLDFIDRSRFFGGLFKK